MPPFPDEIDVVPHLPAMRRYARALLRDDAAADDLVQQALLNAIERSRTFRPGGSLKAWLLAILHNQHVSARRSAAAETRKLERFGEMAPTESTGNQEHTVYLRQIAVRFAALPDTARATLHLVAVEGLNYREASEALGVPVGTVMSRLSRARAALRRLHGPIGEEVPLRIVGGRDVS